jgi:hypothetical protein
MKNIRIMGSTKMDEIIRKHEANPYFEYTICPIRGPKVKPSP